MRKNGNDTVLLEHIMEKKRGEFGQDISDATYFELFTANEILRKFDISYSELEGGNTGGGGDGGLDGIYTFVNGEYVDVDYDFSGVGKDPNVDFIFIQSKHTGGFGESAIDRATSTLKDVLDLDKTSEELATLYNEKFAERAKSIKSAVTELSLVHPVIKVRFCYATRGDTEDISKSVRNRVKILETEVTRALRDADTGVVFFGAKEIVDLAQAPRSSTTGIDFADPFISNASNNYVGLVRLSEVLKLITCDDGSLNRIVFEANVRDFQGITAVNSEILASLEREKDDLNFWWLNNGITVIGTKASSAGRKVTISDAQIVNGLQTAHALYKVSKSNPNHFDDDDRCALVKVIITDDDEARDRIIKATNFQTPIASASLRATDRVQRNIEEFLKSHGWYYDRRKNYYKNEGKPRDKIIGIPFLGQSIMSIVFREPDQARARPSTLLKSEVQYEKIFSEKTPLALYLFCIKTQKNVDAYLALHSDIYPSTMKTNIHFHVAMVYIANALKKTKYSKNDLNKIMSSPWSETTVEKSAAFVAQQLHEFSTSKGWAEDRASKTKDFVSHLESRLTF